MDPRVLATDLTTETAAEQQPGQLMEGIAADGLVVEGVEEHLEHLTLQPCSQEDNTESSHGQVQRKKSKVIFSVKKHQ